MALKFKTTKVDGIKVIAAYVNGREVEHAEVSSQFSAKDIKSYLKTKHGKN
jgi:hypothetical protein